MFGFKDEIAQRLASLTGWQEEEIKNRLETPPDPTLGDYSLPCFHLSQKLKKAPAKIAAELAGQMDLGEGLLQKVETKGPYLNFFVDEESLAMSLIPAVAHKGEEFGKKDYGTGKVMVIDYSAPNIAKPFGIGHLRSTVIGDALYRIFASLGYNCIGINHLGDWGTQFGKLMVAYQQWGDAGHLEREPIIHLYQLYVRFHRESEQQPELAETARYWFKKLEEGDKEAVALWERFRHLSLVDFKRIYDYLGVRFDYYQGESFYNGMLAAVLTEAQAKGITRESEGALVVDLDDYQLPPCLLRKKDGATLYATRDLAAALYRYREYQFTEMLYVVGSEQKLHFQQLFAVLSRLGYPWAEHCRHIPFGLIHFPAGRMSTREGKTIFLEDVINRAVELAAEIIAEKNPNLANRQETAKMVGLGAIKFGDLSNDRIKDIDFDWDKILDFSGETAPYIQYSHARICSILRKTREINPAPQTIHLVVAEEKRLVKTLSLFEDSIIQAAEAYKPSILARYLIDLARDFNKFYHNCPVLGAEEPLRQTRLSLINATRQVLANGLSLLGIEAPTEM